MQSLKPLSNDCDSLHRLTKHWIQHAAISGGFFYEVIMEFKGLHATCAYIGGASKMSWSTSILNTILWSETFQEPGVSAKCAPAVDSPLGEPVFEITTKADAWIAIGKSPDATNGPRIFVWAGTTRVIFAKPGDYLAWQPA